MTNIPRKKSAESRKGKDNLLIVSRQCPDNLLIMSRKNPDNLLTVSRQDQEMPVRINTYIYTYKKNLIALTC